jgi:transcriptional regulator with XRE-family HTH domain
MPGAFGPPHKTRASGKRSSVVARIADLAEPSRVRPVPDLGNRGAGNGPGSGPGNGPGSGPGSGQGLEEALGTAIAARVREFRLQLGWTVGQLAAQSGLSKGMLSKIENAQASPSLATLARLSEALQVPVTAFFRGLSEEQDVMFVKAGRGLNIEHKGSGPGHRYESLGIMRAPGNTLEPLRVTLTERSNTFPLYQHAGTELIYMLSGRMEYGYGSSRYLLESGDILQFIGGVPHGPAALVELPIQFLSIKSITPSA